MIVSIACQVSLSRLYRQLLTLEFLATGVNLSVSKTLLGDSAAEIKFLSCFASGSCSLAKYTKFCMVWQQNIRNML